MPDVAALMVSERGHSVDVAINSMAQLALPAGAVPNAWTKNGDAWVAPADLLVAPTLGQDDEYEATDGATHWSITVRWAVAAVISANPGATADVPTGRRAELQLPGVAVPRAWTMDSAVWIPPAALSVDPNPGHDVTYAATDAANNSWSVTVRWLPDTPAGVNVSPGKGSATVAWGAVPDEPALAYYEVDLQPRPPTAQLPRHVLSGATVAGGQRRLLIDSLPPDFYVATVTAVTDGGQGPVSSPTASSGRAKEVAPGGGPYNPWVRLVLVVVASALVAGAIVRLLNDPTTGTPQRVNLNRWALLSAALITFAILAFVTSFVRPKDVLSGADNRISTSRVNVALWTVVIAFGVSSLAAFAFGAHEYHRVNPCGLTVHVRQGHPAPSAAKVDGICVNGHATQTSFLGLDHTFKDGLAPNYLVLLGAPFTALAGAAFIVNRQVGNADRQKVPSVGPSQFRDALTNDDGSADLVDTQYLIFTGVLLFYFMTNFFPNPSVLPDLPWGLVGLTGVSAGTYLMNKAVTNNALSVMGLAAPSARRGAPARILGRNFLPEGSSEFPGGGVSVMVGGTQASVTKVTNTEVIFTVPAALSPGTCNVQVTTAADITASAGTLQVT